MSREKSMARAKKLTAAEISARLLTVKSLVTNIKDAMPRSAALFRREACEEIDDLLGDLRRGVAE
jgi:hypothetical protein